MNNKILQKIEADKEILGTMPVNNEKNTEKYNTKVCELKSEYMILKKQILEEMKKRYDLRTDFKSDEDINSLQNELNNYEEIIELLNNIKTPYEKSGLNKEVYKLGKYYKENLENVNIQIFKCINIIRNMGIEITTNDFTISSFAKEYMEVFFSEMKVGDVNSDNIKNKFEEIYWKCPDLIKHIEINIKNIYMNNLNTINKFYEKKKQEILSKYKIDENHIIEQYYITKKELQKLQLIHKDNLINNFLNGELNVSDYGKDKVNGYLKKIIDEDMLNNIKNNTEKIEEIEINIIKLKNSIYEYKKYLDFKFIFERLLAIYKEKDKWKNQYKEDIKKIKNNKNKIKKVNKKGFFSGKKNINAEINLLVDELKTAYKNLGRDFFFNKLVSSINEESSIYDILNVASGFYEFLIDCIIETYRDIEQPEIDKIIDELADYVKFPYFTIINNIFVNENKDIALIIKDRYKLLNFKIEKDDLQKDNLDNLLDILNKIEINYAIRKVGLNIEEIDSLCKIKKILLDNNK